MKYLTELTNTRPIIKEGDFLIGTKFYDWLKEEHELGNSVEQFIDTIKRYTYFADAPFKGRRDGKSHKYVWDLFWRNQYKLN